MGESFVIALSLDFVSQSDVHSTQGVAPSHRLWSKHHNRTTTEYLWSVGRTPFGILGSLPELSFVQRDAAARNVIVSQIDETISKLIETFHAFEVFGEPAAFLSKGNYRQLLMRWNVLCFKLEQAMKYFSVHNYDNALYYTLSAHHENAAINGALRQASIKTSFKCWHEAPIYWWVTYHFCWIKLLSSVRIRSSIWLLNLVILYITFQELLFRVGRARAGCVPRCNVFEQNRLIGFKTQVYMRTSELFALRPTEKCRAMLLIYMYHEVPDSEISIKMPLL